MRPSVDCGAIRSRETSLRIEWLDGTQSEFASIWLRDNLPEDRDARSGQRLIDVTQLPVDPRIAAATLADRHVCIEWRDETRVSRIALDWLHEQATVQDRRPELAVRAWLEGATLEPKRDFAWRALAVLQADPRERLRWLTRLLQDGIAFLSEVPPIDAGILEAVEIVGRIAETNYGRVFDVRTVAEPENLAYSDLGLGLHTDNPYREPVPGFQALHVLVAAPDGGDSLFADGFALAEYLRGSAPETFATLTCTAVPFVYQSRDADLYAQRPLIELSCAGAIAAVNYNSRSIAPLQLAAQHCASFYSAYRHFANLLREPRFQASARLANGDLALFDNRRILHGRTKFASSRYARHLRGCYLTRDSVYSATALLRRQCAAEGS
ncbi:MAG: TauD/TfdA family dioxygenase [Steroidobacteraceae bacterium]|jgi:alpha-ketoglutarate-dependent taurine dioxygenase